MEDVDERALLTILEVTVSDGRRQMIAALDHLDRIRQSENPMDDVVSAMVCIEELATITQTMAYILGLLGYEVGDDIV